MNPPKEETSPCQHTWKKKLLCFLLLILLCENTLEISGCFEKLMIRTRSPQFQQCPISMETTLAGGSWSAANTRAAAAAQGQMCGHQKTAPAPSSELLHPALASPELKLRVLLLPGYFQLSRNAAGTSRSELNSGVGFASPVIPEKSSLCSSLPAGSVQRVCSLTVNSN